jgi:6-phosphogluconate dehydrogenase
LISEAYQLLKSILGLTNEELSETFNEWNTGDLGSYLVEITSKIFLKLDDSEQADKNKKEYVIDKILDAAGQKGTGKWTVNAALDFGQPVTLIAEAVFARCISAQKDQRTRASALLPLPGISYSGDRKEFIEAVRDALFASKIVSYAQGFILLRAAAKEFGWHLNFGEIALMWRNGCIIRSKFLESIKNAFQTEPDLENLLLDEYFRKNILRAEKGWRHTTATAILNGIPVPAFTTALSYLDALRTDRLPANLIQAQRDYFGAHTFERLDQPRGKYFHTNWTGEGGSTASTTYSV